jgi:hypothetical protein
MTMSSQTQSCSGARAPIGSFGWLLRPQRRAGIIRTVMATYPAAS